MVTDNSVYFVEDEDGARYLPKKGADNRYHIDGNLRMASGKQASKILEKFLPLFRLLKKNKKLILAPQGIFSSHAAWTRHTASIGRRLAICLG
jgi:hypothetical protein